MSSPLEELAQTTLCLGIQEGDQWAPAGCGFVVSDQKMLWLITSRTVVERAGEKPLTAWVSRSGDGVLLGLGTILQNAGLEWIFAGQGDVAACVFPMREGWDVRALPLAQSVPPNSLGPMMEVHTISFPYGVDGFDPRNSLPLVLPGGLAGVDAERARVYHTAPSLPLSEGAPLLLSTGSDQQRQLLLAGVMNGPVLPSSPVPPSKIPATVAGLSMATPIAAAVVLLSSAAAREQSEKALARAAQSEA